MDLSVLTCSLTTCCVGFDLLIMLNDQKKQESV